MLKKHFFYFAAMSAAVAVTAAVVLSGCDGAQESDNLVNFIIDNQSSYDLEKVRISDRTFTTANRSLLEKGTLSKGAQLPPEMGKTIIFTRKDAGVECSIENVSISIREDRYVIRNNTLVTLAGGRAVELQKLVAPPLGVSAAAASSASVTISWNAVTGADEYYIYRSTAASGAYSKLTTDPAVITGTSYVDTGLSSGAAYYYKVAASNSGGAGEQSDFASALTIPGVPSTVSAAAASSASVTISWSAVTGADEYYIYRSTAAEGVYSKLTTTPAAVTGTSYTDTGLSFSAAYYYKVAASNSGGTSAQSDYASATTYDPPPSAPDGVTATTESAVKITVSWNSVTDATGYYVYRYTSDGTYDTSFTTTSTSYANTGLQSGAGYYYDVAAYNSNGTGPKSEKVFAAAAAFDTLSAALVAKSMPAGGAHWYRLSVDTTYTWQIEWQDGDYNSYYVDITVSAWSASGEYLGKWDYDNYNLSYDVYYAPINTGKSEYIYICVQPFSSGSGTYLIRYRRF
jgi:fibronectin type 3 domain-containing protein